MIVHVKIVKSSEWLMKYFYVSSKTCCYTPFIMNTTYDWLKRLTKAQLISPGIIITLSSHSDKDKRKWRDLRNSKQNQPDVGEKQPGLTEWSCYYIFSEHTKGVTPRGLEGGRLLVGRYVKRVNCEEMLGRRSNRDPDLLYSARCN